MTRRADFKASDADREQVAERLRHSAAEGRLLPDELEDRLGAALSARTYGELDAIVFDLPTPLPARGGSRAPLRRSRAVPVAVAVLVGLILIAALATAAGGHSHPGHHSIGGLRGGFLIWLVWVAIGWRLFAHRIRSHRS